MILQPMACMADTGRGRCQRYGFNITFRLMILEPLVKPEIRRSRTQQPCFVMCHALRAKLGKRVRENRSAKSPNITLQSARIEESLLLPEGSRQSMRPVRENHRLSSDLGRNTPNPNRWPRYRTGTTSRVQGLTKRQRLQSRRME